MIETEGVILPNKRKTRGNGKGQGKGETRRGGEEEAGGEGLDGLDGEGGKKGPYKKRDMYKALDGSALLTLGKSLFLELGEKFFFKPQNTA